MQQTALNSHARTERPAGTKRRRRAALSLDPEALNSIVGVHLRLANVAFYQSFIAATAPLDVSQRATAVLILLGANPGASQIVLAEFLGVNRASMMELVNRLEVRGLLERRETKRDKRLKALHLTRKGRSMLTELKRRISRDEHQILKRFSIAEQRQLVALLSRIHGKF